METLALAAFLLFSIAAIFSHLLGLPRNWAIFAFAFLLAWSGDFNKIQNHSLIILLSLSLLGEIIEFLLGVIVAKKSKASNLAIASSFLFGIIGAVLGAPFFLGIGAVIGSFIGAFIGAFIVELFKIKYTRQAISAAWGTLLGKMGGWFVKTTIGTAMVVVTLTSYLRN